MLLQVSLFFWLLVVGVFFVVPFWPLNRLHSYVHVVHCAHCSIVSENDAIFIQSHLWKIHRRLTKYPRLFFMHYSYVGNENNIRIVIEKISNWINTNILFMSFLSLGFPPPLHFIPSLPSGSGSGNVCLCPALCAIYLFTPLFCYYFIFNGILSVWFPCQHCTRTHYKVHIDVMVFTLELLCSIVIVSFFRLLFLCRFFSFIRWHLCISILKSPNWKQSAHKLKEDQIWDIWHETWNDIKWARKIFILLNSFIHLNKYKASLTLLVCCFFSSSLHCIAKWELGLECHFE